MVRKKNQPVRIVTNRLTVDEPRGAGKGRLLQGDGILISERKISEETQKIFSLDYIRIVSRLYQDCIKIILRLHPDLFQIFHQFYYV